MGGVVIFDKQYVIDRVTITPEGCWRWSRAILHGYGAYSLRKDDGLTTRRYAHRLSYELWVGPIPGDLQIDHLCRVRACVNPAHLEAVTQLENMHRGNGFGGINARKTHCIHGHEFTPENTYIASGSRQCRKCQCAAVTAYKKRKVAS